MLWIQDTICPFACLLGAYTMSCTLRSGLQVRSAVGGLTLALLASLCSCHLVLWHTLAPGKLLTLLSAHCWESILKEDHSGFYIRKSRLRCVAPSSSSSVYHLIILSSVGSLEKVPVKLKFPFWQYKLALLQHHPSSQLPWIALSPMKGKFACDFHTNVWNPKTCQTLSWRLYPLLNKTDYSHRPSIEVNKQQKLTSHCKTLRKATGPLGAQHGEGQGSSALWEIYRKCVGCLLSLTSLTSSLIHCPSHTIGL